MPGLLRFILPSIIIALVPFASALADRPQVMIVLDASGSMWSRIEDKEKILIAREVIGDIVNDWDSNTDLGVIAYGHRRKGDCTDIETVVPLGQADAVAIRQTVDAIRPKGKTPLSAAVQQAARELRFTEERATVILVSDGKETCDLDPCAVGRELEEAGVDFTAHVIGFDVSADERSQLQCLAESTGGRYFDAQKADELKVALAEAVEQVQVQPDQVVAVLVAEGSALADPQIQWQVEPTAGGDAISAVGERLSLPTEPGVYTVTATLGRLSEQSTIEVIAGQSQQHSIVLNAGRLVLNATVVGPTGDIEKPAVQWSIENLAAETEAAQATGPQASVYLNGNIYGVFATYDGRTLDEVVRLEAGDETELSFRFEIVQAQLEATESAVIGEEIEISWQGPDGKGDYITVVTPETPDGQYGNYTYTEKGNPLKLTVSDTPGLYELRYLSGESKAVLVRKPITINDVAASLTAPDSIGIGATIDVDWTGPNNQRDYITITTPDAGDSKYGKYQRTDKGNPAKLPVPDKPGLYEIRYVSEQSKRVLARRVITVTDVTAALDAVDTVAAGANIQVIWQGPNNQRDYITITTPDAADSKHGKYQYTKEGAILTLQVPDQPGLYELRYVSEQSKIVLARRPIEVTAVSANINALFVAAAGQPLRLEWEGPSNIRDFLSVASPEMPDRKYWHYVYTNRGNPAQLKMPDEPGDYELRYVLDQSKTVLARRMIKVVAEAELPDVLATAEQGEVTLQVLDTAGQAVNEGLSWTVYGLGGIGQGLEKAEEARPTLTLPAGIYRANVNVGGASKSLDFIINPGEKIERSIAQ